MITLRRVAVCTMVSLWLAGCSNNASTSAPISSVDGGGAGAAASSNAGAQVGSEGHIVYNRSYTSIPKGSYSGNTYTVKRGDTLFYIAWITGNDYRDLAQRNNIPEPYSLNVGQNIQLGNGSATGNGGMLAATDATSGGVPKPPSTSQIQTATVDSQSTNAYSDNSGKQNVGKMLPAAGAVAATTATAPVTAPVVAPPVSSTVSNSAPVSTWRWPTDGKIIDNFSSSEGGNKGVDIAGSRGQPIFATADGRVVYAGNALRGYGNLIIIKHNDDYLSAYAHNDTMLVREQQEVKAGQKIATMGSTGTSSVRLHFEIRYKGKSVNPLRYLPQR
ncbi:Murein hydrolase activator NlpD precursor [Serratia liquefaciens]|jgi:lipoprotein NlpD|uniref:Murein hydrolase activator NlpD n=1 Tax=Serratia liquefaciens TaxID=614 RepID=A0ABX7D263_SERLI|nr:MULTISPECIES: murein hydrolase activator NlpD [Yersiniaceae]AKE12023.1 peptidase [Serratia liquefaciens]MBF8106653.1 murein hydrolase activator NlpD [Serratia liquefaciens]MCE9937805.1 murein hydrolase activator NlpD [Serratia liquefaciens]MDU3934506.1 murein hydrolase activator NlpD [Serratia liquefaciens]QQU54625.1 murein hydrolase activator NlpD [Serratia liquefaciens]